MKTHDWVKWNPNFLLLNQVVLLFSGTKSVRKQFELCISTLGLVLCRLELDSSPVPSCVFYLHLNEVKGDLPFDCSLSLSQSNRHWSLFPGKVTLHTVQLLRSLAPRFYLYLGKALTPHTAPMLQQGWGWGRGGTGLWADTCLHLSSPVFVKPTSRTGRFTFVGRNCKSLRKCICCTAQNLSEGSVNVQGRLAAGLPLRALVWLQGSKSIQ